eukprot:SAG31_NODE_40635_length_279_cov_8.666667_1_plen_50_part_01
MALVPAAVEELYLARAQESAREQEQRTALHLHLHLHLPSRTPHHAAASLA